MTFLGKPSPLNIDNHKSKKERSLLKASLPFYFSAAYIAPFRSIRDRYAPAPPWSSTPEAHSIRAEYRVHPPDRQAFQAAWKEKRSRQPRFFQYSQPLHSSPRVPTDQYTLDGIRKALPAFPDSSPLSFCNFESVDLTSLQLRSFVPPPLFSIYIVYKYSNKFSTDY